MNKKVLNTLEFHKIIDLLVAQAGSEDGRRRCSHLRPKSDRFDVETSLDETNDALSRLLTQGKVSFSGIKNIMLSLQALEIGSTLSATELMDIATVCEVTDKVKAYDSDEISDSLSSRFSLLSPLTHLSRDIRKCILSDDEIADDASSELKAIRRKMHQTADKIHSQLNSLVNGSLRTYLQDTVITMRGDRYCIPVKAEYKASVPGMIHDQSSSGSTVFIEPASIVKLNNDLKELQLEEEKEILRILAALSEQCSINSEDLSYNYKTLIDLDFIFAKAKLGLLMNATRPIFNEERRINIKAARHPLINKDMVVPIDIRLGDNFNLLIVTGPNTGGKTVSLKTTGLLTLMGLSGLFIPAKDKSELGFFTQIYADIGDEQSIEQSLSTFSSHMKNIIYILKSANSDSLCLFDELCAGTDPTEGAALAISILKKLHAQDIRSMSTTHYSELKVFALSENGVENASCEFDVETLSPTYRLLIGIPGKSNAFAISKKLGLSDDIIDSAKENISSTDQSFEDLLSDLENSRKIIEKEQLEIELYKKEVENLKASTQSKAEKTEELRERILEEAKEEARNIIQEAKDLADESIRNFQKYNSIDQIKAMEKDREKLRNSIKKNASVKHEIKPKVEVDPKKLKPGDLVKVLSMGVQGTLKTAVNAKGKVTVQCGILQTEVSYTDLELIHEQTIVYEKPFVSHTTKKGISKAASISPEVNLIGKTVDEALPVLDKYLDDAYISHLTSVRVVHGKGTGALRTAVHNHLRKMKNVSEYHLAAYGEGDAGVTIVVFK